MTRVSAFIACILLLGMMAGCAGAGSSGTTNPGPTPTPAPTATPTPTTAIVVTVSPATATVTAGTEFSAFSASVTNTTNTAVNWLVDNVAGGNTMVGTIDNSGHYTAPESPGNHTVTAVSQADTTKSGNAQVTVTQAFSVSIAPATASVQPNATQQFTATVTPVPNLGVTWSVDAVVGGNATAGTVSVNGLYTAPALSGTHTITAASKDDATSSASAQITIPAGMAISPSTARVAVSSSQSFTVTATNPSLLPVTWSVDNQAGGSATSGTISSAGAYIAPATAGTHTITAVSGTNSAVSATAQVTVIQPDFGPVSVLTFHNDNQRTGANVNETTLNTANVNSTTFGKVFSYPVDGQVYAQPLYVSGLANIAGATHNVVYVATENNSVYAFDADGLSPNPLWHVQMGTPKPVQDAEGISPMLGITSTPVIDATTDTLYALADTTTGFNLHALDLHTGAEKFAGPVKVTATVPGTGADNSGGNITLEPSCYQRSALALVNGVVFISFAHCNHGWILGYNSTSLTQVGVLNTTPNGAGGTIWMGGSGPATDGLGNLYLITGVDFGDPASGFNDTFLKLNVADLSILDFFTPSDEAFLRANDGDLGAGGVIVLPQNTSAHPLEVVGGGKDGRLFLVDVDPNQMGGFNPPSNPACGGTSTPPASCDKNVQTLPDIGNGQFDNIFSAPAYWNGLIYYHPQGAALQAFPYTNGLLASKVASGSQTFGDHGATPSVSANGTSAGIVWELQTDAWRTNGPVILRASNASNVATELYDSTQAANGRDTAGPAVKFTVPTVVNGRVYVGTGNALDVYGLLSQ